MKTKTIESEWQDYLKKVYPGGTTQMQGCQLRLAFYSGVLVFLSYLTEVSGELSEEEASRELSKVAEECHHVLIIEATRNWLLTAQKTKEN